MGGDEEGTRRLLITGDSCISQQLPAQREARALCARRHAGTSEQPGTPRCPQPRSSLACGFGTPAAPPPGEMIRWVFWLHAESVGALPVQLGVGRRGLTV